MSNNSSIPYSEKLKDPRWQKKRLEILERDGWKCRSCGEKERTLHVHHIFYFPKKEPWEIHNGFLISFCEDCHKPPSCENGPCEKCEDFGKNKGDESRCDGPAKPTEDIIDCIASLLNEIWKSDKRGDFFTAIGSIAVRLNNGR